MDFTQQGNGNQDTTQYSIPFIDRQTDKKDKPDIRIISEVLHIRKTKRLDKIVIYNTTGLQYCNVKEYRSNTILRNIQIQDRDIHKEAKPQPNNNDRSYRTQTYIYRDTEGTRIHTRKDNIVYKQEKIEGTNLQERR